MPDTRPPCSPEPPEPRRGAGGGEAGGRAAPTASPSTARASPRSRCRPASTAGSSSSCQGVARRLRHRLAPLYRSGRTATSSRARSWTCSASRTLPSRSSGRRCRSDEGARDPEEPGLRPGDPDALWPITSPGPTFLIRSRDELVASGAQAAGRGGSPLRRLPELSDRGGRAGDEAHGGPEAASGSRSPCSS